MLGLDNLKVLSVACETLVSTKWWKNISNFKNLDASITQGHAAINKHWPLKEF